MEKHFAELKLLDSDTDWKLKKSFSYFKTPSFNRISLEQNYNSERQSNLVRHYSCEQIFDKYENSRKVKVSDFVQCGNRNFNEYQTSKQYFEPFKPLNRQFSKSNSILQAPKFILKRASNEVYCTDNAENLQIATTNEFKSSSHCTMTNTDVPNETVQLKQSQKSDIESKQNDIKKSINQNTYQDIKTKFRPLVVKTKPPNKAKRKMNLCCCSCLIFCIFPVITVMLAMFLNLNTLTVCNRSMLFANVTHELQQKIHGQENAISNIISHLEQDFFYLKVLCFIGGTGVGKSYSAEIVAKNFPFKKEIVAYDILSERYQNTKILSSLDSYQLLIIENLKLKNLDTFCKIIDILNEQKEKCITVIAIFNVEDVNDNLERRVDLKQSSSEIQQALASKKIDNLVISFEPLREEVLEICILDAAAASDLILTSEEVNEIKQSLLVSGSGCKGAHAKVQVVDTEQFLATHHRISKNEAEDGVIFALNHPTIVTL